MFKKPRPRISLSRHEQPATVAALDRCIQTGLQHQIFSAAACVASIRGHIFHEAVYGSPTMPPPLRRMQTDALFDLASLSKPLGSGLAALVLVACQRLDMRRSVSSILQDFNAPIWNTITVDMLLDHTSGLPAHVPVWKDIAQMDRYRLPQERILGTRRCISEIRQMLSKVSLEAEPGQAVLYSDVGFIILGWIVEHITQMPLDTYLAQEIYQPLDIAKDLFFNRLDEPHPSFQKSQRLYAATEQCPWRHKLLIGEVHDPNAWAMGGVAGHAGLFGTAHAVWRLAQALWDSYDPTSSNTPPFFHSGTLKRFWTRSQRVAGSCRTLAWDTPTSVHSLAGQRISRQAVGHVGLTGTSLWIDPCLSFIGVFLTNAVHLRAQSTPDAISDLRAKAYDLMVGHALSVPPQPPTRRLSYVRHGLRHGT